MINARHLWKYIKSSKALVWRLASLFLLATLLVVKVFRTEESFFPTAVQATPAHLLDKGDCKAIGKRRPPWDNRDTIRSKLQTFSRLYSARPFPLNSGGMLYDHSFALWFILRSVTPEPSVVIESGVHKGHSTWIIRNALPNVKIISLSPGNPELRQNNTVYLTGAQFVDFKDVQWSKLEVNPRKALILFDDHQSAFRRVFGEAKVKGFRKFVFDDNCDYMKCDFKSFKWLCETERQSEWTGIVPDDFNRTHTWQSWDDHIFQTKVLRKNIKIYYEFPPVRQRKLFSTEPLLKNKEVQRVIPEDILNNNNQLSNYHHMCYVELR